MADNLPGQSCSTCRYCRRSVTGNGRMECRRNAPVAFTGTKATGDLMYGWFPVMHPTEWCGEYSPENPQTISEAATTIARLVLLGDAAGAYALVDKILEDRTKPSIAPSNPQA